MDSSQKQQFAAGLKALSLGIILGALSNVGNLLGLGGWLFSLLAIGSLLLYIVGLKTLYPLHDGFQKSVFVILFWLVADVALIAAEILLSKLMFFSLLGMAEIVAAVLSCVLQTIDTVLACIFVFTLCRTAAQLLNEAGDSAAAGLGRQAIHIFWGCALLSLVLYFLSLLPLLGGMALQLSAAVLILGYFIVGAFLNRARKSIEA